MKKLFCCVFLMLAGCTPDKQLPLASERRVEFAPFVLHYVPANMPVETPVILKLTGTPKEVVAVQGVVRGTSMYMGQIPLQFQRKNDEWQVELMLGACTDPAMMWQLDIEISFSSGEKTRLRDTFQSSWPD